MIHRIYGWMILLIVLPDIYIWLHYYRTRYLSRPVLRLLWWLPCAALVAYTLALASIHNFAPTDLTWLNLYLLLVGLLVIPKAIFALTSCIGSAVRRIFHTRYNYGHRTGLALGAIAVLAYIYGLTIGVGRIKVNHVDLTFKDLPLEFDGFRILQFSDLHVGTFDGWRKRILKAEIDSINAQQADLVCFTGDLQNMRPEEVEKMMPLLKQLPRTYFVLGNHDYAQYVRSTPGREQAMRQKLLALEEQIGHVMCNSNIEIMRNGISIYVAGEENDGLPPFPARGNLKQALKGIPPKSFVVILQHDPSAWRRSILPNTTAQLTLSGHTHGGQMQILGWRPTKGRHKEDLGLYEDHGRYLYVSAGLGGLVPFRLNMPNEITVFTLHSAEERSDEAEREFLRKTNGSEKPSNQ